MANTERPCGGHTEGTVRDILRREHVRDLFRIVGGYNIRQEHHCKCIWSFTFQSERYRLYYIRLTSKCREIKTPGAVIERYIHFWLGANITSDRSKSAAYKIIELDLHLDHKTTQYRESQGHEGIRFLSYFKEDGML